MGQLSLRRRRQDRVVNWDLWESWSSSTLPVNVGKTDCCYPKEQVSLSLWAALGSFARVACWAKGRGEVLGVIWRCRCGFPTVGKGAMGLAWGGRGYGRNIQLLEGAFVKFGRYWGCMNQVGDRKEDCIWLEEIKGWEGSGKFCRVQG